MGGFTGIPITQIQSLFQIKSIPLSEQAHLLDEIQTIERGALKVLNEK